jgi:AraC-like DNA-binding protein
MVPSNTLRMIGSRGDARILTAGGAAVLAESRVGTTKSAKGREILTTHWLGELERTFCGDELFDAITDTVYFLKDQQARYAAVNLTLVERVGREHKSDLIGLTAEQTFAGPLGVRYGAQDLAILAGAPALKGELELHLYPSGREGWCLTWKQPLYASSGKIVGLAGLSRDLPSASFAPNEGRKLAATLRFAQDHLDRPLRVADLAGRAGLSPFQFDQRLRAMYGHSAGQYLTRLRMDRARERLGRTTRPIHEIALDCGYADQAAFTRQFRKLVSLTPMQYRRLASEGSRAEFRQARRE